MDAMDIQAVESKLSDVTVTPIPMISNRNLNNSNLLNNHHHPLQQLSQQPQIQISAVHHNNMATLQPQPPTSPIIITTQTSANITTPMTSAANIPSNLPNLQGLSKYAQLLAVIEEMGRDIRPTYTGSRSSTERFKRGIVHARILVRECLMETERSARQ